MNEDIIRMAREAGMGGMLTDVVCTHAELERFAELVAAARDAEHAEKLKYDIHSCGPDCPRYICVATRRAVAEEREECAKVCEQSDRHRGPYFAALIRERGEQ